MPSTPAPVVLDATLVARTRAGDVRAFEAIHTRYRRPLEAFARRLLGSRAGLAEDVVQEVMWRTHRALLADDREILLSPWLHRAVRNRCLDELRRAGGPPGAGGDEDLAEYAGADDVHAVAVRRERLRALVAGVQALPERQRIALVGTVVQGEPHTAMSVRLGVSVGASKALVNRARRTLEASAPELLAA